MPSENNNDITKTSLVPFNTKLSYPTESSLVKPIKNDSNIKGIRDYYDSDEEDIYQYVCFAVRQLLEQLGKYEFQKKPSSKLEIQQLKTYEDGSKYFGQINPKTKKRQGQGIYIYREDGEIYEGNWDNNLRNGTGRHLYADGRMYTGLWKDGKEHGCGVGMWPDGRKYEGDWKKGLPNGKGTMKFANGNEYKGDFEDGKGTGEGVYTYEDGRIYEGRHKDFKADGRGVMHYPDGTKKAGEWEARDRNKKKPQLKRHKVE